jgi:serine/threonine-protein kinase
MCQNAGAMEDGTRPEDEEADPARIAHFTVLGRLGQGGMGVVYRAEDEQLRRMVALKVLSDAAVDLEKRQRFLREARSAAAITHPNVAAVHQVGEADGLVYIAMELVEGETLRARLERGRLDPATARDLAVQIARGLSAAHQRGLVHRDLKPENVMITQAGVVKLLDFGLAKSGADTPDSGGADGALGKTETVVTSDVGRIMGTPKYMSPEQAFGKPLDARSDVFSLGIVLYEMFSGVHPFGGPNAPIVLVAITRDAALPLREQAPEVEVAIEAIVMRCLAKAPADRFAHAGEVAAAISGQRSPRATTESRTDVEPLTHSGTVRRRPMRARVAAVLGVTVVAAAGAGWWVVSRPTTEPVTAASTLTPTPSAVASSDEAMSRSSNPEAQRLFEEAIRANQDGRHTQANSLLMQAVHLDPGFGGAELRLAILAADHDNAHFKSAIASETALAPRDRSLLDAYEGFVAGGAAARAAVPGLDRHLERFPRDDVAWKLRWMLGGRSDRGPVIDRMLAVDPSDANALAYRVFSLASTEPLEAGIAADRCVRMHPRADACVFARCVLDSSRGACTELEADARRMVFLAPDDGSARELLADALAANGAPIAAVRDAMGPTDLATDEGTFDYPRATLVPMLEGDFAEVERIAKSLEQQASANRVMMQHFHPALALMRAYEESGDPASAARVAEDFLARSPAWGEGSDMGAGPPLAALDGMLVATMARGGRFDPARVRARQDAAFGALMTSGKGSFEAWETAYAYGVVTPGEARSALKAFDETPLGADDVSTFASARAFVLAGRSGPARAALENVIGSCQAVTDGWRQVLASFYLGKLDEQAGATTSACAHYAKVVERWGHAKPRSVTADEARTRLRVLACQ